MLDVQRGPDVDAGGDQFGHILPPLVVAAAGRVGVRQLVDQQQAGVAREGRVGIELLEHLAAIGDLFAGQHGEGADHCGGVGAAVGFDDTDQHIQPGVAHARGGGEHFPGFTHAGGGAEEHFQPARAFAGGCGQQRVGIGARLFHVGTLVRWVGVKNPVLVRYMRLRVYAV